MAHISLSTSRLTLVAPTVDELFAAAKNPRALAQMMQLSESDIIDKQYYRNKRDIYQAKAEIIADNPEAFLLTTSWQIVLRDESKLHIGECGFKGAPVNGCIELGYALKREFWGQGYMTEAITALCCYVFEHFADVTSIVAKVKRRNHASRAVLERCGFVHEKKWPGYMVWRLRSSGYVPLTLHPIKVPS